MANSISKFQEIVLKTGISFDDLDTKRLDAIAKTAGDLMSKGMVKEAGVAFEEIGKMFNKKLIEMGKGEIDFADMLKMPDNTTLEKMTSGFTQAIANNIANGISTGIKEGVAQAGEITADIAQQLNALQKRKDELSVQAQSLDKRLARYERLSEISSMDISDFKPLKLEDDIDKQAEKVMGEFTRAEDALAETTRGTKEYNKALIEALRSAENLYRMSQTISRNKSLVKDKSWIEEYSPINLSDLTSELFETSDVDFNKYLRSFYAYYQKQNNLIKSEIKEIDKQINAINVNEGVDFVNQEKAKSALKTLNDIEEAYNRLAKKSKKIQDISNSLSYVGGEGSLAALQKRYHGSVNDGEWEEQYQWLIKFVREYEAYEARMNSETGDRRRNMKKTLKNYTDLYNQVKPLAESAETSLQNVLNMVNKVPLVGHGDEGASSANGAGTTSQNEVINASKVADEDQRAAEETERKAKAEQKANEAAEKKRLADEAAVKAAQQAAEAAEKERIEKEKAEKAAKLKATADLESALKNDLVTTTAKHKLMATGKEPEKESMRLIGASGIADVVSGKDYEVDTQTLVNQIISNFKNSIVMSLHNHPNDIDAFTPSDIDSFAKLYHDQGVKINGIIANGVIKTVDFTSISKEVVLQIGQSFRQNLQDAAAQLPDFFSYQDGNLIPTQAVNDLAKADPQKYNEIVDMMVQLVNNSLDDAFVKNGLESTVKTFDLQDISTLSQYLLDIRTNTQNAIVPVEKLKSLIAALNPGKELDWSKYADILNNFSSGAIDGFDAVNQINGQIKTYQQNISNIVNNDDIEVIKKETGALEDKLDVLRDVAAQYGREIDQRKRNRYEALNQKDMDSGLTPKEEERFWELEEAVVDADEALRDFGEIYDRIILKLEDGKNITILPDDKGLRDLSKFYDEGYGESYNGVEVADVQFERAKPKNTQDDNRGAIEEARILAQQAEAERQIAEEKARQAQLDAEAKVKAEENARLAQEALEKERQATAEKEKQSQLEAEALVKAQEELRLVQEQLKVEQAAANELKQNSAILQNKYDTVSSRNYQLYEENAKLYGDIDSLMKNQKDDSVQEGTTINEEQLKGVLSAITYNVKIVKDNNHAESNKISIDTDSLKITLQSIVDSINNLQKDEPSEAVQAPWALEDTLKGQTNAKLDAIKGVLDNIQSQNGIQPVSDVGNVLATENTLVAIKTAVESINSKTVQGTKISQESKPKVPTSVVPYENQGLDSKTKERVKTAFTNLLKYKTTLQEAGQLSGNLEIGINSLYDELSKISNSGDLATWNEHFKQFKNASSILQTLAKDYETLGKVSAEAMNETDPIKQAQYLEEAQRIRDRIDTKSIDVNVGDGRFDAIYQVAYETTEREIKQKKELAEAIRLANETRKEEAKTAKETAQEEARRNRKHAMTGKASSAVSRAENTLLGALSMDDYEKLPESFKQDLIEYQKLFRALGDEQDKVAHSKTFDEAQQIELAKHTVEVNKLTNEYSELLAEYQKLSGDNVSNLPGVAPGANANISEYERALRQAVMTQTNGKAQIKGFNNETKTLTYTLKTGENEFTTYTAAVRRLGNQMVSVAGSTKRAETFFEASMRKLKEISSYVSAMSVFNRAGQELRRGLQYVKEIDSAMTELRKVTEATDKTYSEFMSNAAKSAEKVGSTMQAVISSTADFARVGYTMEEALKLSETAQILMNTSEYTDISSASDALISALKSFGYEANQALDVVDIFNTIEYLSPYLKQYG